MDIVVNFWESQFSSWDNVYILSKHFFGSTFLVSSIANPEYLSHDKSNISSLPQEKHPNWTDLDSSQIVREGQIEKNETFSTSIAFWWAILGLCEAVCSLSRRSKMWFAQSSSSIRPYHPTPKRRASCSSAVSAFYLLVKLWSPLGSANACCFTYS